ncbi:hypothetical protein E5288_WYG013018 [Bos mutus]|uniref:Uncharacterized protein n=1 Tax=Bos mutus TaxID=72004 RepID=A0A6B0R9V0_9CETA|nr:hypothetical protein [Bos mutus]
MASPAGAAQAGHSPSWLLAQTALRKRARDDPGTMEDVEVIGCSPSFQVADSVASAVSNPTIRDSLCPVFLLTLTSSLAVILLVLAG